MDRLSGLKKSDYKGLTVVPMEISHNVVMVRFSAELIKNGADDKSKIEILYAQNGVTSDKLFFASTEITNSCIRECKSEIPVSATHIYLRYPEDKVRISKIDIYEETTDDGKSRYPLCIDKDFQDCYSLENVSIVTDDDGYYYYSIYTSVDNEKFDLLASKDNDDVCKDDLGITFDAYGKKARYIRLFVKYHSTSANVVVKDIKFSGKKVKVETDVKREIKTVDFENSKYNVNVSKQDTINEIYGIIERRLGKKYISWFVPAIEKNPESDYDYFEISCFNNKIKVKGNSGVSIAFGINYYLKYFCNVNITEVGDQNKMPNEVVKLEKSVFKETKAKIRYAFNYCTHSYTMAFWGEEQWRSELDYLALNGVNLILDLTALEEVFRRFLSKIGYSHDEIKKFIAGPGYYSWAYMSNLFGYGGPVPDSFFERRTELARKNHLIMRKLGMYPVLQGYSGIVPPDIKNKDSSADVIDQGGWCSFVRPFMIRTTGKSFSKYAKLFYESQKEVYGSYSNFFATDPFHEGGILDNLSLRAVSKSILSEMLKYNKNAVWVIQAWQENPKSELLAGLSDVENGHNSALILDLYAEKTPHFNDGGEGKIGHGYQKEFDKTPWIFCMLNNFGGRCGLHGHLDNLQNNIPNAINCCKYIKGIGVTPEASQNNPLLYDFIFESVWQDNANEPLPIVDLSFWLKKYALRRYGYNSDSAVKALEILRGTVYLSKYNMEGQGAPECILNSRPGFNVQSASTWGNSNIGYDKNKLISAAKLLLEDYEILKISKCYQYDLITVLQQILSNIIQNTYNFFCESYKNKDVSLFDKTSSDFLFIADLMDKINSCNENFLLGKWLACAKDLSENTDDFTESLFVINAKSLITTWGSYNQSEIGRLHDYSNRQWSGLISDFYKKRWEIFMEKCKESMTYEKEIEKIDWFDFDWKWVLSNKSYSYKESKYNLKELANSALKVADAYM